MAISDLDELLRTLTVRQRPGLWCVITDAALPLDVVVAATIVEDEGTTAVIDVADAARLGIEVGFVAAWLTLEVVSALDAVGFTAAVAAALADEGIACNVLAGFHHDHLLVPHERAGDAIAALDALRTRRATPEP